jgi:hypothetical protein
MKINGFILLFGFWISAAAAQESSLSIAWAGNTESDLLGYRVHYGTSPGTYNSHKDVGNTTEYEISGLTSGVTYHIALTAIDIWGNESGYSTELVAAPGGTSSMPWQYSLESAYPNPARVGETTILRYALPEAREEITLEVYNALGQRVRAVAAGPAAAGYHQHSWDGRDDAGRLLAAGVYYVRFQTGIKTLVKPITFIH